MYVKCVLIVFFSCSFFKGIFMSINCYFWLLYCYVCVLLLFYGYFMGVFFCFYCSFTAVVWPSYRYFPLLYCYFIAIILLLFFSGYFIVLLVFLSLFCCLFIAISFIVLLLFFYCYFIAIWSFPLWLFIALLLFF